MLLKRDSSSWFFCEFWEILESRVFMWHPWTTASVKSTACIYFSGNLKNDPMFSFGYGPFAFVGKHFALLEIKVTISRLLKKFTFTIDPECEKYWPSVLITMKLYPDLKIRVYVL